MVVGVFVVVAEPVVRVAAEVVVLASLLACVVLCCVVL